MIIINQITVVNLGKFFKKHFAYPISRVLSDNQSTKTLHLSNEKAKIYVFIEENVGFLPKMKKTHEKKSRIYETFSCGKNVRFTTENIFKTYSNDFQK
jgi:DNA integrity scanning protein DisA with diadenylate cyclase activity